MEVIRASHAVWTVAKIERNEHGRDDGYVECATVWSEAEATAERERLERENTDEFFYYVVMEDTVTVVYPADEQPPWVHDSDRLRRRGYESV